MATEFFHCYVGLQLDPHDQCPLQEALRTSLNLKSNPGPFTNTPIAYARLNEKESIKLYKLSA